MYATQKTCQPNSKDPRQSGASLNLLFLAQNAVLSAILLTQYLPNFLSDLNWAMQMPHMLTLIKETI